METEQFAKHKAALGPLPVRAVIDRHVPTGIAIYGYAASHMRAYGAQERASEFERWRATALAASDMAADDGDHAGALALRDLVQLMGGHNVTLT